MKKIAYLFAIFISIFLFYIFRYSGKCQNITCIDIKGLNGFRKEEVYVNKNGIYRALYANSSEKLKIEAYSGLEENDYLKIRDEFVANAESFYQKSAAPYPGEISDSVTCDSDRIPELKSEKGINTQVFYFSVKLNDRFVYSCTQNDDKYNGMTLIFYCKNRKNGYILEFISDISKPAKEYFLEISSVNCL